MKTFRLPLQHLLAGACLAFSGLASAQSPQQAANGCPVGLSVNGSSFLAEETFTVSAIGPAGFLVCIFVDTTPGPTTIPGLGTFGVGLSPNFFNIDSSIPPSGELQLSSKLPCDSPFLGSTFFVQGLSIDPFTLGLCITNQVFFTVNPLPNGCTPQCSGQIGDRAFVDLNGNGLQDNGEPGLANTALTLLDSNGQTLATTTTGSDGSYAFTGLCAGEYTVVVDGDSVTPGLVQTLCEVGTDKAKDSSCGSATAVLTTDTSVNNTLDFGFGNCASCSEDLDALTLQYNGSTTAWVKIEDDNSIVFWDMVDPGEAFTFFGQYGDDHILKKELKLFVNGTENAKFKTNCDDPIGVGFEFGAFTVLAGSSVDGGLICKDLGCEIDKPEALCFRYTGEDCSASNNPQDGKATCSGNPNMAAEVFITVSSENGDDVFFSGNVVLGAVFEAKSQLAGKDNFPSNTLVKIYALGGGLLQTLEIHTSCSQELSVGNQFGALLLTKFTPKGFGEASGNDCTAGKPQKLAFTYTGQDCSASNNPQGGKATCSGNPDMAALVQVVFRNSSNDVYFMGNVALGASFEADATVLGDTKFPSNSFIDIYSTSGQLLQSLAVHTSCSQVLAVGNQFGSMLLTKFTPEP